MKAKQAISAIAEDDAQDALRTLAELNGSNYMVDPSIPEDETADVLSKDGTCRFPYAPHSSMNVAWIRGRRVKVPANVAVVLYQAAFGGVEASMLIDDWVDSLTSRGIREDDAQDALRALDVIAQQELNAGDRVMYRPAGQEAHMVTFVGFDTFNGGKLCIVRDKHGATYHVPQSQLKFIVQVTPVTEDKAEDALDAYDDVKEFKIDASLPHPYTVETDDGYYPGCGVGGIAALNRDELARIVEEGRDDINTLPIPASAKRYARMSGLKWTGPAKRKLYMKVAADLANPTRKPDRWRNFDCAGKVQHSIKI